MLTIEEREVLSMYQKPSLSAALEAIEDSIPYIDDPLVLELVQSAAEKLKSMSGNEYLDLAF